jgi:hypothetical protein
MSVSAQKKHVFLVFIHFPSDNLRYATLYLGSYILNPNVIKKYF